MVFLPWPPPSLLPSLPWIFGSQLSVMGETASKPQSLVDNPDFQDQALKYTPSFFRKKFLQLISYFRQFIVRILDPHEVLRVFSLVTLGQATSLLGDQPRSKLSSGSAPKVELRMKTVGKRAKCLWSLSYSVSEFLVARPMLKSQCAAGDQMVEMSSCLPSISWVMRTVLRHTIHLWPYD